jgi:hypothetical protein
MPVFTIQQIVDHRLKESAAAAGIDRFLVRHSVSQKDLETKIADYNSAQAALESRAAYQTAVTNRNIDYKESLSAYNTKKQILASDLSYYESSLPSLTQQYNLKKSYSESLLENLQNQFKIQNQLLDSKYGELGRMQDINLKQVDLKYGQQDNQLNRVFQKEKGAGVARWAAGGFGSIGMTEAIQRDSNSYYAREKAFNSAQQALDKEALNTDYVTQKKLEASMLEANHYADSLREKYNIASTEMEYSSAQAELGKKISDTKIQQEGLVKPTARAIAAPAGERAVAG